MIAYSGEKVTVFQSVLYQITSTVIELDEGILIVDPAFLPNEIQEIQTHVRSIKGDKDCFVLFTHGDYDHIIGYKAFPEAKTIGGLELQNHPNKQNELHQILHFDATYYLTRDYEIEFPEIDVSVHHDRQIFNIGSTTLTFYKAPGHTQDSIFTFIDSMGIFITGDYLSNFELPYIYTSAKDYEDTIRKAKRILEDNQIKMLIPGHGQHTQSYKEMNRRIELALNYLEKLKHAIIIGDEQTINNLEGEFAFYSPTTVESHRENVAIMKRDYLKS